MSFLQFDDIKYWDVRHVSPIEVSIKKFINFRSKYQTRDWNQTPKTDLIYSCLNKVEEIIIGKIGEAQEEKLKLEENQRQD